MKKVLATLAAVLLSGAIASASYIPNFSGASEPSQIFSYLNQLIGSIQSGVSGVVANGSGVINSTATTVEQTLAGTTIPANTLSRAGQALRLRCAGSLANSSHSASTKLYYGTSSITTPTVSTSGQIYDLELMVIYQSAATQGAFVGRGAQGTTVIAPVAATNSTDDMSTALTAKCTTTQFTASAADAVLNVFYVEQVK